MIRFAVDMTRTCVELALVPFQIVLGRPIHELKGRLLLLGIGVAAGALATQALDRPPVSPRARG